MSKLPFSTLLFDMDGTLLDSEPIHEKALRLVVSEHLNKELHFNETKYVGQSDMVVFRSLLPELALEEINALIELKNQRVVDLLKTESPVLAPNVVEFLTGLKVAGHRLAVVSASEEKVVEQTLKIAKLHHLFEAAYSRARTARTKPSPSPYLKAMRDLDLFTGEVLIVEDSRPGLTAALATGARVLRYSGFTKLPSASEFDQLATIDQYPRHFLEISQLFI